MVLIAHIPGHCLPFTPPTSSPSHRRLSAAFDPRSGVLYMLEGCDAAFTGTFGHNDSKLINSVEMTMSCCIRSAMGK